MCLKKIVTFFPIKIPQKATATNCLVQSSSSHKPRRVTCVSHQNHFLLIDLLSPPKAFINLRLIDNDLIFTVTKLKKKPQTTFGKERPSLRLFAAIHYLCKQCLFNSKGLILS